MYYILENTVNVKKWESGRASYSVEGKTKQFLLKPKEYALIKRCDGMTDLPESNTLYVLEALGVKTVELDEGEQEVIRKAVEEWRNRKGNEGL